MLELKKKNYIEHDKKGTSSPAPIIVSQVYMHTVAQYANHIYVWGASPHESRGVWNKPLHCKVPYPFLRKGVARDTTVYCKY